MVRIHRLGYMTHVVRGIQMAGVKRQDFSKLSAAERKIVGDPEDYDWEHPTRLAAKVRPSTVQFSLRVEVSLLERLQDLAAACSSTVSEVARDALDRYVESGGRPSISNVLVSFPRDAGMLLQVHGGQAVVSPNRIDAPPPEEQSILERTVTY